MPSKPKKPSLTPVVPNKDDGSAHLRNRKPLLYIGSVVLLVIVVIAFVALPISTPFRNGQPAYNFGSYDGVPIDFKSGNYFSDQYNQYLQQLGATNQADSENAQRQALQAAFEQTVVHTAFMKEAQRLKFSASDIKVNQNLMDSARFQDNGKFSKDKYAAADQLEVLGMQNLLREDLIQNRFTDDLVNGPRISDNEENFIKGIGQWQRSFSFVSFDKNDYPDSEISAYIRKNDKLFRSMELSSITVASKASADAVRQQIVGNKAKFEDLAKTESTDVFKDKGGSRGKIYFYDLQLEIAQNGVPDTIFGLKTGDVSQPIPVPQGFVIFRADSAPVAGNPDDATLVALAKTYVTSNERGIIEDYLVAKAKSFVEAAKKSDLSKTAKSENKTVQTTVDFPINVDGIAYPTGSSYYPLLPLPTLTDNQAISNAASNDAFFEAGFKLKAGEISDPVILQDEVLVLSLKSDKQASDSDIAMFSSFIPSLLRYYVTADVQNSVVDRSKLVDNVQQAFAANFRQN